MHPTDPISVQQLRSAELLLASEAREHHRLQPKTARRHSGLWRARASALRERLFPTRYPVVGAFSGAHELFRGLDRAQLESLSTLLEVRSCSTGESLGRQNEPAVGFTIVLDAQIGVSIGGLPVQVLDEGSHFGSIPLLDRDMLNRASFDVLDGGLIAVADPHQFRTILDQFPTVANGVYAMARSRRSCLEQLAACETNQKLSESALAMLEYPAHLPT